MFSVRWKFLWIKFLINYQGFQERGHPSTGEASEMRDLKKAKIKDIRSARSVSARHGDYFVNRKIVFILLLK